MGGDKFVAAVAGDEAEHEHGDALRDAWEEEFDEVIDEVAPLDGARELIASLKERGHEVVLASSSVQKHFDHFIELLGVADVVDGWTTKDDVEASKPEPDLVHAALEKVQGERAVMLGDTPWDVEAARRAGIETVCLITGGFSEGELRDAGAAGVFESLDDLRERLAQTPFAAA
jgi:HAD superfamily hydrolase (TIGR01509 family)